MVINVDTTKRKYFRQLLELLKPIPPFNSMRGQKLDVLAELLYYNYLYKSIDKLLRYKILFDYETKVKMRETLGLGEARFNNLMSELRKLGIITARGLVTDFGIDPDKDNGSITFKFNVND